MVKPYRLTRDRQYIGLPLAFGFLGASFVMGLTLFVESTAFVDVMRWFQILTQTYAFTFLALTYYFLKKGKENIWLELEVTFVAVFSVALISYLFILVAPTYDFPSFSAVNICLSIFNIICLSYVTIHVLRTNVSSLNAKTIWIPFCFVLFDFSQYSFLIWSLDASLLAFLGAHFLRLAGLLIFLIATYRTFCSSGGKILRKGIE